MQDHSSQFRLDRRLQQRRGWISSEQLEKELRALPDIGEKAEVIESPQHKGDGALGAEGDGAGE